MINIGRRDSGWLRLIIIMAYLVLDFFAIRYSYLLILKGVTGEFEIRLNFSELSLYISSVVPGIILAVVAIIITLQISKTIKNL
jgi:hypothetical protein